MKARIIIVILALVSFAVLLGQKGGTEMGQTAFAGVGGSPAEFGADMPPGSIVVYAGSTPPAGWLLCDGALYDITAVPELFNVIQFTYGSDTMKKSFRVPDLTTRVPIGMKPFNLYADTLGKTGGSATVSLSESEMPSHKHNVSASSHSHTITESSHTHSATASPHGHAITDPRHNHGVSDPGHGHGINDPGHDHYIDLDDAGGQYGVDDSGESSRGGTTTGDAYTGISIRSNGTGIGVNSNATGITVQNTTGSVSVGSTAASASAQSASVSLSEESRGSGNSHDNMPPYIVMNYIIKY